ncbi:hypothetical protein HG535_0E01510 [Zygotorulaspora mrakii]|uniref:Endoplasmic reticulum junction formation protein lunapark n=1 Tax=Zygotorulaspora mrakii TaxID=42260 RepID=A0A7H9B3K4_ZYGMR|nr:uncharacterized protein HG535_0E01510 [Zygotorulaspora mrakii]QLG73067.1 hypothetical protein HG535_0E01510 [Zygotorulaspora mrakii]
MFSAIKKLTSGSKKTLVQRYTDELSEITSQIHDLDRKLEKSQLYIDRLQSHLTYYGAAITICTFAYLYWKYEDNWIYVIVGIVTTILLIGICKWGTYRVHDFIRRNQSKKLARLRARHQEKLEKLKEETNYHATNSIIHRFSGGDDQSEDTLKLMDEELKGKYEELNDLKKELAQLRNDDTLKTQTERDKWFDKVINAIGGGNDFSKMMVPIVCGNCRAQTGSYRMLNRPLNYACPICGWIINETNEGMTNATDTVEKKAENKNQ